MISGEQLKKEGRKQFCVHGHDTYVCGRKNKSRNCLTCIRIFSNKAYWNNPRKDSLRNARWRRNNPEKERLKRKRWRLNNPEKHRASKAKRNALKRNATIGDLTEIAKVYSRAQELRNQGFDVQVDHIIPLSKGGAHSPENLQILYTFENLKKGSSLTYVPEVVFT